MGRVFTRIQKRARGSIIPTIRIAPIVPVECRFGHHKPIRVSFDEFGPAFHPGRKRCEPGTSHFSHNPLTNGLLPPALRFAVIHHHVRTAQLSGYAKAQNPATHAPIKGQA